MFAHRATPQNPPTPHTKTTTTKNTKQTHSLVWNSREESYRMKNKRNDSLKVIATEIGADVEVVKKKIDSLLSQYRREKKIAEPKSDRLVLVRQQQLIQDYHFTTPLWMQEKELTRSNNYVRYRKNPTSCKTLFHYTLVTATRRVCRQEHLDSGQIATYFGIHRQPQPILQHKLAS
ncbi:hypothetical protein J6590_022813 [Homalodisca vitripennis]|nr:hypothetical protein J6590_022813 [Homalodisca vitripennis]